MGGRAKAAASEAQSLMAMDVGAAMALLKDEDKTTEFFAKIATLRAEIAKDLEAIGTADQIDRLLIKTRDNHTMSEEEIAGARTDAKTTRDAADRMNREAKQALEDAGAEAAKLIADADTASKKQTHQATIARKAAQTHEKQTAEILAATKVSRKEGEAILAKLQGKLAKAQELIVTLET